MNIFDLANNRLESFIQTNLSSYKKLRNYDFGIKNRTNVSQISKYTTHRILYEYEIIEKLKIIDTNKVFTDEILWRIYWKGYLENYQSIWNEYKNFKAGSYDSNSLKDAKNGNTGIKCFDTWIDELRGNNYLHNHSRMWFASIWIFTLGLPWQLGASLFMRHLLDGDAASNTLSWRWVAGMHTNNKPYIATRANINKYTVNRFSKFQINLSEKIDFSKTSRYKSNEIEPKENRSKGDILIMFDNDMNISNRFELFNKYSNVYIISNERIEYGYNLSDNVANFKQLLISDINRLIPNSKVLSSADLEILLNDFKNVDVIYPGVGNNLDLINTFAKQKKLEINYIFRKEDLIHWNFANSGFFKFKSSFYKLKNK